MLKTEPALSMFGANLLIMHVRMLALAFSSKPCRAATHGEVTFFYPVNEEKYTGLWFCLQSISVFLSN